MTMTEKYRQRVGRCSTRFEFGAEELTYMFDSGGKAGSAVPYHKIPHRPAFREVRLWWLKYAALSYLVFCAIIVLYYQSAPDIERPVHILYYATLAFLVLCFAGLRLRTPGMTSFALDPPLVILQDRQADAILSEIMKRRSAMMRAKLAVVDTSRPCYEESAKFSWLREEAIISDEEYRDARHKITAMRDRSE